MDKNASIDEHLSTILHESRSIALASILVCIGKRKPELFLGPLRPIVEVAELHRIEALDWARSQFGGAFRDTVNNEYSKNTIELMRQWMDMPHRKKPVGDLILLLALQHPEWRPTISKIRAKWQKRLKVAKNKAPPWLDGMVARMEPDNWKAHKTETGTGFEYVGPDLSPKPTLETKNQLERTNYLTILPHQCEQILEGKTACTVEQLADWWSRLPEIRLLSVPDADADFQYAGDTLCAVAAVAVVRHSAWLAADCVRLQEVLRIFKDAFSNPPKSLWFWENETTDYKWDNFAAWAITALWCENPTDPFLADFVAALAIWKRYIVVERVMLVAAANRVKLGANFDRLLAHIIRCSPARDRFRHKSQSPNADPDDREYREWLANHLQQFRAGTTKPLPAAWLDLAEPVEIKEYPHPSKSTGLDLHQIFSALTWASDLTKAKDTAERSAWLRYHRECLLCALLRISILVVDDENDRDDSYNRDAPYEDEKLILERIGIVVAHLNPSEDHRQFWEPIFALGSKGSYWVEAFIFRWLLEAAGHNLPSFVDQWRAMLAYAEAAPTWKSKKRFGKREDRMWHCLLGFSPFTSSFWTADLAPTLNAIREYHERWATENVDDDREAEHYIYFLLTQGARPLRINGLVILNNAWSKDSARSWHHSSVYDAVASLLERILAEHWVEVVANQVAKTAFMDLVLKLVSLQHSLGAGLLAAASSKMTTALAN